MLESEGRAEEKRLYQCAVMKIALGAKMKQRTPYAWCPALVRGLKNCEDSSGQELKEV